MKPVFAFLVCVFLCGCAAKAPVTPSLPPAPILEIDPAARTLPENSVALVEAVAPDPDSAKSCPDLPPICAGGLLPQRTTPDKINAYVEKYNLTFPLTCRFQQPPRCYTGQSSKCSSCTP